MARKPTLKTNSTLEPLTGKNTDGEIYQRTEDVEQQIIAALALQDVDIIKQACIEDKDAEGYLQEESLTYFIRKSFKENNLILYNALSEILVKRCQQQLTYRQRSLPVDLKEEAYADVFLKLFKKICVLDGKGDFLQVRFWKVFDALAIDAFRKYSRQESKDYRHLNSSSFSNADENDEETDDEWEMIAPEININVPDNERKSSVEIEAWANEALQVLEEPIRTAFVLYYKEGWPIQSNNPDDWTLMKRYKVSAKTINTWIRQAKSDLKKWQGDQHE